MPEALPDIHTPSISGPSTSASPEDPHSLVGWQADITAADHVAKCLDIADGLQEPFDWNSIDFDTSKLQPLDLYSPSNTTAHGIYDTYLLGNSLNYTTSDTMFITSTTIPTMPPHPIQRFTRTSAYKGSARMTAIMMKRILTAYPMMLRNRGPPPPFIHASMSTENVTAYHKPLESLSNCKSLMHLLGSGNGNDASKRLVWKNVGLECERVQVEVGTTTTQCCVSCTKLCVQYANMGQWELLSSMQALLIYTLLRLGEGETADNNIDVALLSAMWVVVSALNHKMGSFERHSPFGLSYGTTHDDWVFEESRRRWYAVFKCLGMLFTNDGSDGCTLFDSYAIAPLPAKKALWDARDEQDWLMEKSNWNDKIAFGLKLSGRMAKLRTFRAVQESRMEVMLAQPTEPTEDESEENWKEWCSGTDDLGALIMLAATLRAQS
jgi:hypothetical protein